MRDALRRLGPAALVFGLLAGLILLDSWLGDGPACRRPHAADPGCALPWARR